MQQSSVFSKHSCLKPHTLSLYKLQSHIRWWNSDVLLKPRNEWLMMNSVFLSIHEENDDALFDFCCFLHQAK